MRAFNPASSVAASTKSFWFKSDSANGFSKTIRRVPAISISPMGIPYSAFSPVFSLSLAGFFLKSRPSGETLPPNSIGTFSATTVIRPANPHNARILRDAIVPAPTTKISFSDKSRNKGKYILHPPWEAFPPHIPLFRKWHPGTPVFCQRQFYAKAPAITHKSTAFATPRTARDNTDAATISRFTRAMSSRLIGRSSSPINGFLYNFPK